MSEPRYTQDIFKKMFLWMGIGWIVMGLLGFAGILKPTADSMVQDSKVMGMIFTALGIVFFIAQSVMRIIVSRKKKLHDELIANGTKVNGTVEKVYRQNLVRYGGKYPYIIYYAYTYEDKVYHGESHLFWDIPDVMEHDPIVVYTNHSGKSTIQ